MKRAPLQIDNRILPPKPSIATVIAVCIIVVFTIIGVCYEEESQEATKVAQQGK